MTWSKQRTHAIALAVLLAVVALLHANRVDARTPTPTATAPSSTLSAPVLSAQATAANTIEVSWDATAGAVRYELWGWWSEDTGWQQLDDGNLTDTNFRHTELTSGATYFYAARAVNAAGQTGPWSEYVSATVTAWQTTTPTPTTDTLDRTPGRGVLGLDIGLETTLQQVFDTFTAREQSCIRDSFDSDTLDALLAESFMQEDSTLTEEQFLQFFSCLNEETAEALVFALIVASEELIVASEENDLQNATLINVGDIVEGTIDYAGDVDVFSFRAEEGKFYQVDAALGTLEYAGLLLLDSRGGFLASDYEYDFGDSRASRIIWEAPGAGDYYAVVQGDFRNAGSYTLTIGLFDITDDHGNSKSDATAVAIGAAVQGSIDYAGDADYFSFRAEEGELYQIDAALGTLEDEDSELSLLDSGGMILAIDHSFENFLDPRIIWEAPSAGDYYVVMKKSVGPGTGSYTLTISPSDFQDDHGNDVETATTIEVETTVAGIVDYGSDVDIFRFTANVGQGYQIDVALGALHDSLAILRDSDGSELTSNDDHGDSRVNRIFWKAPDSGDYYVEVSADHWGSTGSYTLTISPSDFQDDHGNDVETATTIEVETEEAEGEKVSEASITCMQELLQDFDIVALMSSEVDSPEAEEFFALSVLCLERPAAYFRTPPPGSFRIPFERLESDSVWQAVFDEYDASEQTCIRNELGEELLASELDRPSGDVLGEVLWGGLGELGEAESVWWTESVLECLGPVTMVSLIHSFQVAFAIALGGAESSDEADQMNACLWRLLSEDDVALLAADGPVYEGYESGAERCLWTTGSSAAGPPPPSPPPDDSLLWKYRDDDFRRLDQSPIVVDGMVYATTGACQLHALDARTGESQWSFDIRDEKGTCARPVVEGGVVHFGERALDAFSGELLPGGTYPLAPSATGKMVYETDWIDFQELRAIDAASGELAWSFNPGETVPPVTVPTVSDGVVYLQLYENAYALDESTGAQIWSFPAEAGFASTSGGAPVIDAGIWYLTADTHLYALDTATGQPLWSHDLEAPLYHLEAGRRPGHGVPWMAVERVQLSRRTFVERPERSVFGHGGGWSAVRGFPRQLPPRC